MTLCEGKHDLKLSITKRVLPNIHTCTKCDLVLVPVNITIDSFNAMKEELVNLVEMIDEGAKGINDFVEENKA